MCIRCPECWKDTILYRTKEGDEENTVKRYRRCLDRKCGYKFTTTEEITGEVKPWRKSPNTAVADNSEGT